ncbi:adenylate cyclase [bacterium]|nr:adenylate cyclase [bacterium]
MFRINTLFGKLRILAVVIVVLAIVLAASPHTVFAANPPGMGQPNQSCEVAGVRPGHSMTAPGSAFNPNGVAGMMYAGSQLQNSKNPMSVSQYDVACYQVSLH